MIVYKYNYCPVIRISPIDCALLDGFRMKAERVQSPKR
jgi:hypothetical protein